MQFQILFNWRKAFKQNILSIDCIWFCFYIHIKCKLCSIILLAIQFDIEKGVRNVNSRWYNRWECRIINYFTVSKVIVTLEIGNKTATIKSKSFRILEEKITANGHGWNELEHFLKPPTTIFIKFDVTLPSKNRQISTVIFRMPKNMVPLAFGIEWRNTVTFTCKFQIFNAIIHQPMLPPNSCFFHILLTIKLWTINVRSRSILKLKSLFIIEQFIIVKYSLLWPHVNFVSEILYRFCNW